MGGHGGKLKPPKPLDVISSSSSSDSSAEEDSNDSEDSEGSGARFRELRKTVNPSEKTEAAEDGSPLRRSKSVFRPDLIAFLLDSRIHFSAFMDVCLGPLGRIDALEFRETVIQERLTDDAD